MFLRSAYTRLLLVFVVTRLLFGFNLWMDPGLAQFEDDFLLAAQQWEDSGKLYPAWGPVLPGLLRAAMWLGAPADHSLRLLVVGLWQGLMLLLVLGLSVQLRPYTGERLAFLAALALTLDPAWATPSFLVATEVPYLFLLCGGVWAWTQALEQALEALVPLRASSMGGSGLSRSGLSRSVLGWSVLSGVLLGVSALTRGNGLLVLAGLIGLTLLLSLWALTRGASRSRAVALFTCALVLAGTGLPPIVAWSAKNAQDYGHFSPTSSGDHNIAVLWIGPAKASHEGKPVTANLSVWADRMPIEGWSDPFARSAKAKAVALEWAKTHPWDVVVAFVRGQLNTVLGPGSALLARFSPLPTAPLVVWAILLRLTLLLGLVFVSIVSVFKWFNIHTSARFEEITARIPGLPHGVSIPWLLAVWGIALAHVVPAGAGGYSRFFFPVLPFLYATAALSLAHPPPAEGQMR